MARAPSNAIGIAAISVALAAPSRSRRHILRGASAADTRLAPERTQAPRLETVVRGDDIQERPADELCPAGITEGRDRRVVRIHDDPATMNERDPCEASRSDLNPHRASSSASSVSWSARPAGLLVADCSAGVRPIRAIIPLLFRGGGREAPEACFCLDFDAIPPSDRGVAMISSVAATLRRHGTPASPGVFVAGTNTPRSIEATGFSFSMGAGRMCSYRSGMKRYVVNLTEDERASLEGDLRAGPAFRA